MKKLICGGLAALALGLAPVAGADPITPDEWEMDDGIGVGTRTAGYTLPGLGSPSMGRHSV